MSYFYIDNTFFTLLDYPISYLEFFGTIAGIIAVWLAAKSNILTWPIGLINIGLFFIIFFQVQLYSDMFLQVYFFGISIYGWYNWIYEKKINIPIKVLELKYILFLTIGTLGLSLIFGFFIKNIHSIWPQVFTKPAAYPYTDSFVTIASIVANTLLAKRYFENWIIWIIVDIICIFLYAFKEIIFVSFEFFIFLLIAIYGHWSWWREYKLGKV